MAYLFTEDGNRTVVKPGNGNYFTEPELKEIVGFQIDIFELPGDLYAVTIHNARQIGGARNNAAYAGHAIHMAHLREDGLLQGMNPSPEPEFYGPVLFCKTAELGGTEVAYTGKGEA